ncbi:outer membrane protein assembly factor BamD, partial [Vibrio cholerae]
SLDIQLKAYQQLGLTDAIERTKQLMQLNPL